MEKKMLTFGVPERWLQVCRIVCRIHARALAAGLPRQDHVWIGW